MDILVERFSSPNEFIHSISTRPVNSVWEGRDRSSRRSGDEGWSGTETWEEAVKKAQSGYTEITDNVRDALVVQTKRIFKRVEERPSRPINSIVGGSPNVIRAMMGIPRDMRVMERTRKPTPGVTIVYELGVNARTSVETIVAAGSRMLALVKLCEREQIPVRLIVSETSETCDKWQACEVVIKDFSTPLNLRKIAYYLAHPSMLRRLCFSWMETSQVIRKYDGGYGRPLNNDNNEQEQVERRVSVEEKENAYFFMARDFRDDDSVMKWWDKIGKKRGEQVA